MKLSARILTLTAVAVSVAAGMPAFATTGAPSTATTVAQYNFDNGATTAGNVADSSGRGMPLAIRTADQGAVKFVDGKSGKYISFPAACAKAAQTCPRALLEAANDADLNPGTRTFTWGASLAVQKSQVVGSPNIVQKGIAGTDSQWKMQLGATLGRAQCVVVGRGSAKPYIVRSAATVADGVWHRVLCERSGTALTIYVDGVNKGRVAVPSTLSVSNTHPLRIGGPNFNTSSDMYHGMLDDVYATVD